MRRIIGVLAALAAVGLVATVGPVGAGPALPGGFTADPPAGTVATAVTVTGTFDVPCPGFDTRLSLLPPVGDDTVIADNGLGAGGSEVLLDITPDDIPTAGVYRLRMTCAPDNFYFVDWPVTEPEPEPDPEIEPAAEAEPAAETVAEVVEAAPTFTG